MKAYYKDVLTKHMGQIHASLDLAHLKWKLGPETSNEVIYCMLGVYRDHLKEEGKTKAAELVTEQMKKYRGQNG